MSFIYLAQSTDSAGRTPIAVLETTDRLAAYLNSGWCVISEAAYRAYWRENARLARASLNQTAAVTIELPPAQPRMLECQACRQCGALHRDGYYECPRCYYRWEAR